MIPVLQFFLIYEKFEKLIQPLGSCAGVLAQLSDTDE